MAVFPLKKQLIRKRCRPPGDHCHSPKKKTKDIVSTRSILRARRENRFMTQNDLHDEDETWDESTNFMRPISTLQELFQAFRIPKSFSLRKNLAKKDARWNIDNWEENAKITNGMKTSVANLYKLIMSPTAVLICGPAAQVSISQSITHFNDLSHHVLIKIGTA